MLFSCLKSRFLQDLFGLVICARSTLETLELPGALGDYHGLGDRPWKTLRDFKCLRSVTVSKLVLVDYSYPFTQAKLDDEVHVSLFDSSSNEDEEEITTTPAVSFLPPNIEFLKIYWADDPTLIWLEDVLVSKTISFPALDTLHLVLRDFKTKSERAELSRHLDHFEMRADLCGIRLVLDNDCRRQPYDDYDAYVRKFEKDMNLSQFDQDGVVED